MFTVVQFFEKQKLRVLAVPVSWVRDGYLMWPKLPSNEKLNKLRTGGNEFHGATRKIPVILGRRYRKLQTAETAANNLLKLDISDIEAKRKLLKHSKGKTSESSSVRDYNNIIQEIASSKVLTHLGPDNLAQKKQNVDAPINEFPDAPIIEFLESSPYDYVSGSTSDQSQPTSHQRKILGADDNIICINPPPTNFAIQDSVMDSFGVIMSGITSLKSEIEKLNIVVTTLETEMTDIKNEMTQIKHAVNHSINTSVKQVMEDCLEVSFSRFATMLDMDKRVQLVPQEGKLVEEHEHINDEYDLIKFNKMMADKKVFEEYIKYFTKIIPPTTYYGKGDSACYLIVDCLFTRPFWNNFTWTGINRGNKSKRGFREFANVLQLLLAIVSVGDPTYTSIKLEAFCKNRLFRYSKARSSSKQLRKSTCRRTRRKEEEADDSVPADDDEDCDEPMDNITTDSYQDELDNDSDEEIEMKSF